MTKYKSSLIMLGRLMMSVPQFFRPIDFRAITCSQDFQASAHLVYNEYVKRSYLRPNNSQMKLSVYQTLPTTTTFVAMHHWHGVMGTITVVQDSPLGLPMDDAYKIELDELRRKGLKLAEPTLLSLNSDIFGKGVFTMFHAKKLMLTLKLFKVLFDYLRSSTDVDELVACFNPKHQVLYDFLQMKPLGGRKIYTGANSNPAIAKRLNIKQTEKNATSHAAYRLFYGKKPTGRAFTKRFTFSQDDLRNFFIIQAPILNAASPTELAYIKACYPDYDFNNILAPTSHIHA